MDEHENEIRTNKDRLRIFLILFTFSTPYSDAKNHSWKRKFESEQRIQKIDFLLRNPDYFAFELIELAKQNHSMKKEIKEVAEGIISNEEPTLRRLDMERFFYGAYEDIDNIISFLVSIDFIHFNSKKSIDLKPVNKTYYITQYAIDKINSCIDSLPALTWYVDRCNLIKKYFGDLTGNQLRIRQYKIDEYKNTSYRDYITGIESKVKEELAKL